MNKILAIIKSLRIKHWVKNMFVFAALVFAVKFTDMNSVLLAVSTFFLFCFAASSVYLLNDVADYESDKLHPKKKNRSIPSGELSRGLAIVISLILAIGVILTSLVISPKLSLILTIYFLNNLLYTFVLKRVVVIDVMMIAFGFVLRAVGGAVAIGVVISSWFIVVIFLLAIFLGVMKRRQEFIEIEKNGGKRRKVLDDYSIEMLDQMATILAPAVLVSYIFYTFNTSHTQYLILTIPFVVYGIFRYLFLVHKKELGENPTETLLEDLPLLIDVTLWAVSSVLLLYYF